ncbi:MULTISPECIES: M15 family metallopeptidase [Tenacibaculum]|uniref:D-alanyl-D-alanine carboxypeptidase n=1 Tax=Tenacibaculum todarodis TaxID=1850252 RepID=A0A1L3JMW1_9FLAO|nr:MULTISPECIES: M15 family metallopeptidase [Tenacibaculum]APG66485.1 D-alanyl-D-alanine carboxypeptidase [Tenacibaculum todarodis]MCH3883704.1 M15 family metallopeptidase [Tenacibaculum aquimarinum]
MKRILMLFIIICSCKEQKKVEEIVSNISVFVPIEEEIENQFDKNFILGKFNYRKDTSFVKVKKMHSSKTLYIKRETYLSFVRMFNSAKLEGINLKIISGTRNFYEQKSIWERKWERYKNLKPINRAKKILEYSSMPSTSRHHWGTDIDLNNLNNSYFDKGIGKKEYDWLVKNANKYGFFQVYVSKVNGRKGYNIERWHWSYIPLSGEYLKHYRKNIKVDDISGFKGSELSKELDVINVYVNGVSKQLIEDK